MSNAVTIDIRGNNRNLKGSLNDSESMLKDFGGKIKGVFLAVGAAVAVKEVFNFGASLVQMFAESQESEQKLASVIRATGGAAGFTKEQLVGLSEELQNVTKYEAETTQGAMSVLASFRNVRGDVFIEATKAAQDMSTVLGTDLSGSAMQLGKALNDPVAGIAALSRAGVTFTKSQEDMINTLVKSGDVVGAQRIILEELRNEFGGAAEDAGKTAGGKLEQMKNRIGDIGESLGGALFDILEASMPIIDGVITAIENMVPAIQETIQGFIVLSSSIMQYMEPVFTWLVDAAVTVFTGMEWAIENFSKIWERMLIADQLIVVGFANEISHQLTEVLPQYLSWFANNWFNILTDIGNFHSTVLGNMANNIWEFIKGVQGWLSGSGEGFQFTALLEGFQMTTEALPEIAARAEGALEASLRKQLAGIDNELMNDFGERFNRNKSDLEGLFRKEEKAKTDLTNKAKFDFNPDDFTTKDEKKDKPKAEKKEEDKSSSVGQFVGLQELNKRISEAAANAEKDKKQVDELKKVNENLEAVRDAVKEGDAAVEVALKDEGVFFENPGNAVNKSLEEFNAGIVDNQQQFDNAAIDAIGGTDGQLVSLLELSTSRLDTLIQQNHSLLAIDEISSRAVQKTAEKVDEIGRLR